jgi:hypothetical protein
MHQCKNKMTTRDLFTLVFLDIIHRPDLYLKIIFRRLNSVSVIRLKTTQLGLIGRASSYFRTREPAQDRIYRPNISSVDWAQLSRLPDDGDLVQSMNIAFLNKNRMTDYIQKVNNCINIRSSQTYRPYLSNYFLKIVSDCKSPCKYLHY